MKVLVTGAAGFIGFYVIKRLLELGEEVVGLDNINEYYDIGLKYDRLDQIGIKRETVDWYRYVQSNQYENYRFIRMNLEDKQAIQMLFANEHFDKIIHLAAQAGVRYSIQNPYAYVSSNVDGFLNILEGCRHHAIKHLIFASSSSVYGLNGKVPFSEHDGIAHPVSLYAATKKTDELMAHTYSHLYGIPVTGLRFFTVYGPWGRPDMAPLLFANAITNGQPIKVFNNGELSRDFTYIDDIIDGIQQIINHPERAREDNPGTPAVVYNIGHGSPMPLMRFIALLEQNLGREAIKEDTGMQAGDVYRTWADTSKLLADYGYVPKTTLEEGIKQFTDWFKNYKSILPDKK